MGLLISILIGAVAGWLAGQIMGAKSGGLLLNIILGLIGSFVGDRIFNYFQVSDGNSMLGSILTATVGAIVLIVLFRVLFGNK